MKPSRRSFIQTLGAGVGWSVRALGVAVIGLASVVPLRAQGRAEVSINDTLVSPENLTSSRNGAVFFGSTARGTIYRAAPGATRAEPWIQASTSGLSNVLGVLADDKTSTLWVCANATSGPGGAPVTGRTALRAFDLKTGAAKGTYSFPNGGLCNDVAVSADGTTYASETFGANPTYVAVPMEVMVDRPAADVWKRVGKYCDIAEWMRIPCAITAGEDGDVGAVRVVAGMFTEVLVGRTELSYTYAQPVREGRPYDLYHGTLEARPMTATTSKLVYTLMFDNSTLPDDAARKADIERRRAMFTQALQNMKALAEGRALPPAP